MSAERRQVSGPGLGEQRQRPDGSVPARLARSGGLRPLHSPVSPQLQPHVGRGRGRGGGPVRSGPGRRGWGVWPPPPSPAGPAAPAPTPRAAESPPGPLLWARAGARRRGPAPPGPRLRWARRAGRSPRRGSFPSPRSRGFISMWGVGVSGLTSPEGGLRPPRPLAALGALGRGTPPRPASPGPALRPSPRVRSGLAAAGVRACAAVG